MFNIIRYKQIARKQLKNRLFTPILVFIFTALMAFLIIASASFFKTQSPSLNFNKTFSTGSISFNSQSVQFYSSTPLFFIIIQIALLGILVLTKKRYYIELSRTTQKIRFSFYVNTFTLWAKGILSLLWYALWVVLWSLLFIIPGIVKMFSYSQMFFILAEHPDLSITKAMNISKVLTRGHKADLLIMMLSFIPWILLCIITCGIASLWLEPYMQMSFTNAYHDLKAEAVRSGALTAQDFID